MNWIENLLPLIFIYAILVVSLGLLMGHLGIFSMSQAALFGVGAYSFGILTVRYNVPELLSVLGAVAVCVVVSAVISAPALRVSEDYFLVASFGAQVVLSGVFQNWDGLTGGASGLGGITRISIGGLNLNGNTSFLIAVGILCCLSVGACSWLVHSSFGTTMHAVRDDEIAAAAMGIPTRRVKIIMTLFAGGVAGLAGALYAQYLFFLSPDGFTLSLSVTLVAMVVIGGQYTVVGTALGAAVMLLIPQWLQGLDISAAASAAIQQMVFGALLVVFMIARPGGIFGGWTDVARRIEARRLGPSAVGRGED